MLNYVICFLCHSSKNFHPIGMKLLEYELQMEEFLRIGRDQKEGWKT